jgi:hypothetical protein
MVFVQVCGAVIVPAVAGKEIIIIMTHSNFIYTERERAKGHAVRFSLSAIYFGAKVRQNTHSFSNIYLRAPTPFVPPRDDNKCRYSTFVCVTSDHTNKIILRTTHKTNF